jgi:hypothetical protein
MLGLRTAEGVSADYLRKHCTDAVVEGALKCSNLVALENGSLRIPENRFFISDNIISSLI